MKPILIPLTCLLLLSGNLLFSPNIAHAQNAHFITDGTIEYDKTVNMHAIIAKRIDKDNEYYYVPMFEQYKKTQPQFQVLKSTLSFSNDRTLFQPIPSTEVKSISFVTGNPVVEQNNTIYTDFTASSTISQKTVFEQTFLVKDSTRKITWKITDETRDIAGYSCRRANGVMLDSIYIVAFYTIAIPVSGGPESFSGLPGMILEAALPHENITWVAKKVNITSAPPMKVPTKGKAVTNKELRTTLSSALKDWGSSASIYLKAFLL